MENIKNSSAKNPQIPFKEQGQVKKTDSFFNDILSSSQNKFSLSGKYIRNLKTDKTTNYNKAYSFVKDNSQIKESEEKNIRKDIYKKRADSTEEQEDRIINKVKDEFSKEALNKPIKDDFENMNKDDEINESIVTDSQQIGDGKSQIADKPSPDAEKDDVMINNQVEGDLNEQQIKEMAAWILNQFNNTGIDTTHNSQIASQQKDKSIETVNANAELMNILTDKSGDLNSILPKLQKYIADIISENKGVLNNIQNMSGEGIDKQLLNGLLEKLVQTNSLENTLKPSIKQINSTILEEEKAVILDNAVKPVDISGKNLQNQLQLLKADADGNLFSGEKSFMKELMISDKKISDQLMDFNGQKTFVQNSTAAVASQPLTNRNASFMQMISKISEEIRLSVDNNKTQMTIKLEPEALGRLTVKITSENGIMNASFYAENDKAKTMIENHMAELRNSLEKQGIQIQNLTVTVDQNQQELTRHKNIMEAKNYSKNKGMAIQQIDENDSSVLTNPYFTQDLFNDLI